MRPRTVAALAVFVLALTACGGADGSGGAQGASAGEGAPEPIGTLTPGDPVPEWTFPVLGGDGEVATSDWRGRPAIVNFWATWCAFCVDEMPDLEQAHQQLGDRVHFVGIDRQDNPDKALALAAETGVTYQLLESADGRFFEEVRGRGMPTTLFVDADGTIQHRHTGPVTTEQVIELAREHLGVTG